MFLIHMWLPRAHVEASTIRSIYLASVLLKLGLLGVFRLGFILSSTTQCLLLSLLCLGGACTSFICITLVDLKSIVAFSSILHIAIPAAVMISPRLTSSTLGLLILLGHGLISPYIFFTLPHMYGIRTSRNILMYRSGLRYNPIIIAPWAVILLANLPAPPFISFLREVFMFHSLGATTFYSVRCVCFVFIFRGVLFCYLFSSTFHSDPLRYHPSPPTSPITASFFLIRLLTLSSTIPFSYCLF